MTYHVSVLLVANTTKHIERDHQPGLTRSKTPNTQVKQYNIEHIGDECPPCSRAARLHVLEGANTIPYCWETHHTYKASVSQGPQGATPQFDHVNQQYFEHRGDECAPCNRPARRKCTKGRTQFQTVGKQNTNTKRASARAHKEQNRNCVTLVNKIYKHLETSAHLPIAPQGASARMVERYSKLLGNTTQIQGEPQQHLQLRALGSYGPVVRCDCDWRGRNMTHTSHHGGPACTTVRKTGS